MAKVGAQRAADLTGKSKSTIQRAMNSGKLSYEIDSNNRRIIDVSELERVFGLDGQEKANEAVETELKKATDMIEMERMKMRIRMLEDQLDGTREQLEDMRGQRDEWQKQAQQVLITSQYSQKQAEELKAELKERERRAAARRQQMMEERMKSMKGENQNQGETNAAGSASTGHAAAGSAGNSGGIPGLTRPATPPQQQMQQHASAQQTAQTASPAEPVKQQTAAQKAAALKKQETSGIGGLWKKIKGQKDTAKAA